MEATRGETKKKAVEDRAGEGETKGGRPREVFPELCSPAPVRLTVWCKSLLFNSHGYTVYDDADGRMVFRVDNYAHNWKQETVLMDRAGHVLLTIRRCRKILNLTESWEAYKGDKDVQRIVREQRPLFKATKDLGSPSCTISMFPEDGVKPLGYRMSWSREKEWSKIYQAAANTPVAEKIRFDADEITGQRCFSTESAAWDGSSSCDGNDYDHKFNEVMEPVDHYAVILFQVVCLRWIKQAGAMCIVHILHEDDFMNETL